LSVINPDFESLRTALINSYSSQTTNHVGYVLALAVGVFVLISSKDFLKLYNNRRIWFLAALSLPFTLIEYFASQIVFWAWMNTTALTVTENEALVSAGAHNTTVIFGIQTYLTGQFRTIHGLSPDGISSFFYRLDQQWSFGIILSFLLLFALTFSLIYMFSGFYSEYYDVKSDEWLYYDAKKDKIQCLINALKKRDMKEALFVFIVAILISLIFIIC